MLVDGELEPLGIEVELDYLGDYSDVESASAPIISPFRFTIDTLSLPRALTPCLSCSILVNLGMKAVFSYECCSSYETRWLGKSDKEARRVKTGS